MLKPVVDSVVEQAPSRYAMVIGVAKRAREIVEKAQANGEILVEKPVGIAVDQLMNREYDIIEITDEERLAAEAKAAAEAAEAAEAADVAEPTADTAEDEDDEELEELPEEESEEE